MRRILAAVAFIVVLALPAMADTLQVQALNADKAFRTARGMKDIGALERILAPDFLAVDESGREMTRAQYLHYVKADGSVFHAWGPMSEYTVRVHGDMAIVTGNQSLTGRFVLADKTEWLQLTSRASRVWKRTKDGWKLTHTVWFHTAKKPLK